MARGRPRAFDVEQALDRAMHVFWRKGYEGASLPDLTKAMGINRPSLYAAFGNKEALFRKAVERYIAGPAAHVQAALQQPTARGVVEHLLRGSIDLVTDKKNPRGCFLVQGALACGDESQAVRKALAQYRAAGQAAMQERFTRAMAEGDLPADVNPGDLTRYVTVVAHGLAVQAVSGATRAELLRVAEIVMTTWPGVGPKVR